MTSGCPRSHETRHRGQRHLIAGEVTVTTDIVQSTLDRRDAEPQRPLSGAHPVVRSPDGRLCRVIFKRVGEERPYPEHGYVQRQWAAIAPQQIRLDQLVTTKRILDLEQLLEDDSTFYGDLFAHVIFWQGDYYLEDGLHRALRAALQQRQTMHARVLELK